MISTPETRKMAQDVLDFIEANPEMHNQSHFFSENACGTTMCVAGTAAHLKFGWNSEDDGNAEIAAQGLLGFDDFEESELVFYEMDKQRALNKVRKMAAGIPFEGDDFLTADNDGEEALSNNYGISPETYEFLYVE